MKKLYNELLKQGKYTKSFEEFKSQFGSEDGQKKKAFFVLKDYYDSKKASN